MKDAQSLRDIEKEAAQHASLSVKQIKAELLKTGGKNPDGVLSDKARKNAQRVQ